MKKIGGKPGQEKGSNKKMSANYSLSDC